MIMAIESSGTNITSDFVKTKLLQHVTAEAATNSSNALFIKKNGDRSNYRSKQNNGKGSSGGSSGKGHKSKAANWMTKVKCFECDQIGHIAQKCPKKQGKTEVSSLVCFTATHTSESDWYIDSGASKHMTNQRGWFTNKMETSTKTVTVANNHRLSVEFAGDVRLSMDRGANTPPMLVDVKNFLYVPGLCTNLLSVSQLLTNGCSVIFGRDGCDIRRSDGILIARAVRIDNMFRITRSKDVKALCVRSNSSQDLWHRRLGHVGGGKLKLLNGKEMVNGMSLGSLMSQIFAMFV